MLFRSEIMKRKNYAKPCIIYQDDEFGLEVFRGADDSLKAMGKTWTEKTTYKRGATDFSSQVARISSPAPPQTKRGSRSAGAPPSSRIGSKPRLRK